MHLNLGDVAEEVIQLQERLAKLGFYTQDTIHAEFDSHTEAAVKAFQSSNGLEADGIVGPLTWRVITQLSSESEASPVNWAEDKIYAALLSVNVQPKHAARWSDDIKFTLEWAGIQEPNEIAAFLANVLHESAMLSTFTENLNYSADALLKLWPTRFTRSTAGQFGRLPGQSANQQAIASIAYGGRMGNKLYPSLDGWNFRGRGPIQLTGYDNYKNFFEDTGVDILHDPDLLLRDDQVCMMSAGWFWKTRECFKLLNNREALCRRINGGLNGLQHRNQLWDALLNQP